MPNIQGVISDAEIGRRLGITKPMVQYYRKLAMDKIKKALIRKFGKDVLMDKLQQIRQKNILGII